MTGNGCISFYQSSMNKNYHRKLRPHVLPFRIRYKQCAGFIMAFVWYISLEYIPNLCFEWSKVDSTTIFLFWKVQLSFWGGLLTSCCIESSCVWRGCWSFVVRALTKRREVASKRIYRRPRRNPLIRTIATRRTQISDATQPESYPHEVRSPCLIMLQMELPSDNTATVADYFNWIEIASFKSR